MPSNKTRILDSMRVVKRVITKSAVATHVTETIVVKVFKPETKDQSTQIDTRGQPLITAFFKPDKFSTPKKQIKPIKTTNATKPPPCRRHVQFARPQPVTQPQLVALAAALGPQGPQ